MSNIGNRLLNAIPGGAHVYSKGFDQFPNNIPRISNYAKGSYIFDDSGEKFLDWGMALRSVTIGYSEKTINKAAIEQINFGNTSTLPTNIELEAAERIISLIDSIEMVKFSKDGSTATTAAIKLARAFTGKKYVLVCNNHPFFSYNDWFIGITKSNKGCLIDDFKYTKTFEYNNIKSIQKILNQYPNQISSIILEPALSILVPENDFLCKIRKLCNENNIVLNFDEMITGFRWHLKGAQYYYNVKPDLSTFGKGVANGFSVSFLGGKKEIMSLGNIDHGDKKTFFMSATHGAERCGLGAMLSTIDFYEKFNVVDHLWETGNELKIRMNKVVEEQGLGKSLIFKGLGCLPYYLTLNKKGERDPALTKLFQQEMAKSNVIMRNISVCYRHTEKEIQLTVDALKKALKIYKMGYENNPSNYIIR